MDLESTEQGILVPRTDTATINAAHMPATGLLIFQTSDSSFYYFNGSFWDKVGGDDADADPTNEIITAMDVVGDSLSVTEGGSTLKVAVDSSNTNEIQSFSVSVLDDTLFINNGNFVVIPGLSVANYTVQQRLDLGATPKQLYDEGILLDSLYGKVYEGGLIFYMNTGSGEGLVVNESDLTDREWGCQGTDIPPASCPGIGCGDPNTDAIIANCLVGTTAAEEARAFDDGMSWFLASSDELQQMYFNLHLKGFGNFSVDGDSYWSSTQSNNTQAVGRNFGNGSQTVLNKSLEKHVRAVKSF